MAEHKIDESRESEPNSEVADHKTNEPEDAKTLSEPRVTVALKDNFLEVHYFEQSLSHWKVT